MSGLREVARFATEGEALVAVSYLQAHEFHAILCDTAQAAPIPEVAFVAFRVMVPDAEAREAAALLAQSRVAE